MNYEEDTQRKMAKKHTILNHWGKHKPTQKDLDKVRLVNVEDHENNEEYEYPRPEHKMAKFSFREKIHLVPFAEDPPKESQAADPRVWGMELDILWGAADS